MAQVEPQFPTPILASQLQANAEGVAWLWKGFVARNSTTLLSALWKAGKTTLLSHLLRLFEHGGTLAGMDVNPARVLYVSEESQSLWAERRDRLGIADHVLFLIRPFLGKPNGPTWLAFLKYLSGIVQQHAADLVVLDTLSSVWPVRDENDAAHVQEALMPLHELTPYAAVWPIHHLRKGDGQEATASRGSGALPGFVDTILELRRYNPSDRHCRRRVLKAYGRYPETPDEAIIELAADGSGYLPHGTAQHMTCSALALAIRSMLPTEGPGVTSNAIRESWPTQPRPHKQKLLQELKQGYQAGLWHREGTGKSKSPFRYWRSPN